MRYNFLGSSQIKVSEICLGTMTWGEQVTEKEAFNQIDYAVERGVNFIDTAEMYPIPPFKTTQGMTEKILGQWLKKKDRSKIIVATKVTAPSLRMMHIRGGDLSLNRKNIKRALDNSLRRLQVDYIDLYQIHWPERDCNFFGQRGVTEVRDKNAKEGLVEILQVLEECVHAGKVREIGVSNETAWGVMKYLNESAIQGKKKIQSIQNPYNLLNRQYEVALSEISLREEVSLLAYSPLAFGTLTGKYLDKNRVTNGRLDRYPKMRRYQKKNATSAIRQYLNIANKIGISLAHLSLEFVRSRPFVSSTIIGATNQKQLKENIDAIDIELSEDVLQKIEDVFEKYPNPCP